MEWSWEATSVVAAIIFGTASIIITMLAGARRSRMDRQRDEREKRQREAQERAEVKEWMIQTRGDLHAINLNTTNLKEDVDQMKQTQRDQWAAIDDTRKHVQACHVQLAGLQAKMDNHHAADKS